MKEDIINKMILALLFWAVAISLYASETFTENELSYKVLKNSSFLTVTGCTPSEDAIYSNDLHIPAVVVHDGKKCCVDNIG